MEFNVSFKVNENLFLKNPENSEVGKSIVKNSIELIYETGFESFTFKKLAQRINSAEVTIYRYFSSKHKLLTYILNWYWSYIEFTSRLKLQEMKDPQSKMGKILEIITHHVENDHRIEGYDLAKLHSVVIAESSKSYLVKEVDEINQEKVFNPLKSLCSFISEVILEAKPDFPYPKSLASTLLETAHDQQYFSEHLPGLTDNRPNTTVHQQYVLDYLKFLTFNLLK